MTMPDIKTQAEAARKWWYSLQAYDLPSGIRHPGDRATLARLRRCPTPLAALAEPATIELFERLGFVSQYDLPRAATLAVLLAGVRENSREKIARALGAPAGGKPEDALLKPLRFKRLTGSRGEDETLTGFRRAIQMLDRKANVKDLARIILLWNQNETGDRERVRFAFEYYNAGAFAPSKETTEPQKED